MAAVVAKRGLGSLVKRVEDGADLIVVLLKAAQTNDLLQDYDDLGTLIAHASTDEADFTNYTRKVIDTLDVDPLYTAASNRWDIDIADLVYTDAGGATNNTLVKLLVCIDGANDAARLPVSVHDLAVTTDGTTLTVTIPTDGFYRAAA